MRDLIARLKHLALDYPENRDQFLEAICKLNKMQEERLDQLTLNFLLQPNEHIDAESEDLIYQSDDEASGLIYLMWGNFGKNPRRREVEWQDRKIRVELKKEQAIEDVALRVIYTKDDTLNLRLPDESRVESMAPPEPDVEEEEEEEEPANDEEETEEPEKAKSITESEKKEPSQVPSLAAPPSVAPSQSAASQAQTDAE